MTVLADSDAVQDQDRQLAQHQAILTIVQALLADPSVTQFMWLDLACGKGQILAHLEDNIGKNSRAKICYFGYDAQPKFTQLAERQVEKLGVQQANFKNGEVSDFSKVYPVGDRFDLITLTNVVHEIDPYTIATLMVDTIGRLSHHGRLFVYDMESLPSPELGAITWTRDEIRGMIVTLFTALGIEDYDPDPGQWHHRKCRGWNIHLERKHLLLSHNEFQARSIDAVKATAERIHELLVRKLERCKSLLESLTKCGPETEHENADKIDLLHQFWALSRAQRIMG